MNAISLRSRFTLAATLAVGATLLLSAVDAGARERAGGMHRPAPRGDFTRHTERQRTDTGHTRQDTWTNSNGKQVTRDATVVNDKDAGVRTRDVEWTGPNGKTATREDVTTKTENGYTRESTFTNPAGKTITRDASVVNDKDAGTRTREATTTLPDGRTRTLNDVTTKTDTGYTRDTTITNPNGATLQRDVTATKDPVTGKWTKDVSVDRTPAPKPSNGG
jgi:hypothetical protein